MGLDRRRRVLGAAVLMATVVALTGVALAAVAKPSLTTFTPTSGKAGTKITITGKHLQGATAVKVGGAKATFKVASATKITATVPAAAKTGKLSVTTKGGTASTAKSFTVSSALSPAPATSNYAPNGSGTLTASPGSVAATSTGNTIALTYTAAAGGMNNGTLVITVPAGWAAPVTTATAGCVSGGYPGVVATQGQTITAFNLTLAAGASAVITYGAKSGGSFTGATCTPANGVTAPGAGTYSFALEQKSTDDLGVAGGVLTAGTAATVTVS